MSGTGLLLVLDSDGLEERLVNAVRSAWEWARNPQALLASAAEQIVASLRGFEQAGEFVSGTGAALVHRLDRCGNVARVGRQKAQ
jgi:hypothetical protein